MLMPRVDGSLLGRYRVVGVDVFDVFGNVFGENTSKHISKHIGHISKHISKHIEHILKHLRKTLLAFANRLGLSNNSKASESS